METIDWIDLILGLICVAIMLILLRQNKPKMWPRIFGIGGGMFMFVLSMIRSWLLWPKSEFVDYIISNFLWSLAMGIWAYFCGRILVRRFSNEKDYNHKRK
jgi:hypothetical protein